MSKIEKFEDIVVWQKATELCISIYSITNNEFLSKDYNLKNQLRKSALSISSNIAEGFERGSNLQFIYFLAIAKASTAELRSQLFISKSLNFITENEYLEMKVMCLEIGKMLSKFISYLKSKKVSVQQP